MSRRRGNKNMHNSKAGKSIWLGWISGCSSNRKWRKKKPKSSKKIKFSTKLLKKSKLSKRWTKYRTTSFTKIWLSVCLQTTLPKIPQLPSTTTTSMIQIIISAAVHPRSWYGAQENSISTPYIRGLLQIKSTRWWRWCNGITKEENLWKYLMRLRRRMSKSITKRNRTSKLHYYAAFSIQTPKSTFKSADNWNSKRRIESYNQKSWKLTSILRKTSSSFWNWIRFEKDAN